MLNKYVQTKDKNLSQVTTEQLNGTLEGTISIDLEAIKQEIKKELIFFATNFGELQYRLAKTLHEHTKNLSYSDTHKIYSFVSDYLGISTRTIKNLLKVYRKLEKFSTFHDEVSLFKLRMFQLAYYIDKNVSNSDEVLTKAYMEIFNDFKLRIWFTNASYKEILIWFKERYKTYLRVFRNNNIRMLKCDVCSRELHYEEYQKTWDYLPICFDCYDMLKESNKDKLAILRNTIAKKLRDSEIVRLNRELEQTKKQLLELIEQFDKIRLSKSRKYKQIIQKITT